MGAECAKCGHDLPYDGGCQYCALEAELHKLRGSAERMKAVVEMFRRDHFEFHPHYNVEGCDRCNALKALETGEPA